MILTVSHFLYNSARVAYETDKFIITRCRYSIILYGPGNGSYNSGCEDILLSHNYRMIYYGSLTFGLRTTRNYEFMYGAGRHAYVRVSDDIQYWPTWITCINCLYETIYTTHLHMIETEILHCTGNHLRAIYNGLNIWIKN